MRKKVREVRVHVQQSSYTRKVKDNNTDNNEESLSPVDDMMMVSRFIIESHQFNQVSHGCTSYLLPAHHQEKDNNTTEGRTETLLTRGRHSS